MTQADQVNRSTFRRNLSVFAVALFIFGLAATGGARAADPNLWTVTGVSGKARVLTGGTAWTALGKGMVLQPGNRVETGRDGRISLTRPGDSLAVSPNSRFEIPAAGKTGTVAHLKQALGTLLFKITTRPENPFNVQTPYLTAVIKGTTFTVSVDQASAALHVAEGAVEVTSSLSGQTVMVNPGQTAISRRGAANLRLTGNSGSRRGKAAGKGNGKTAEKSTNGSSKATGGSNGSKAEGSNESSKSVGASKASNTAIGASTNSNPDLGGANAAPASPGNISMALPELGAGRINIFQVTKGLVNDGNKPAMSGPGSDKNTAGKSSLAGSISSQEPARSSVAKVPGKVKKVKIKKIKIKKVKVKKVKIKVKKGKGK